MRQSIVQGVRKMKSNQREEQKTLDPSLNKSWKSRYISLGVPSFLLVSSVGVVFHFLALDLSEAIFSSGLGREGNPLYYLMGSSNFVVFGFLVIIGYYVLVWISHISLGMKIVAASWLTLVNGIDFSHDLLFLLGHHGLFLIWPWPFY